MSSIFYKAGYKYQLVRDYSLLLPFKCPDVTEHEFLCITSSRLTIKAGYAWDGPSGPIVDTSSTMRGSLIHDALYQLMRMRLLADSYRGDADVLLRLICVDDGMNAFRAGYMYYGVRLFGTKFAVGETAILTAP